MSGFKILIAVIGAFTSIFCKEEISALHSNYYKQKFYQPLYPIELKTFQNNSVNFQTFLTKHNYHSKLKPLIGQVTENSLDMEPVFDLLVRLSNEIENREHLILATDEILAKIVAYRQLQVGQKIPIPCTSSKGKVKLVIYKVDKIFSLLGMPAFGLIPSKKKAPSIILFRGTDLSLSMKGTSSILADLDLNGPGVIAYHATQDEIRSWIEEKNKKFGKARAIGYSLGGALVEYCALFDGDLLSKDERFPSTAFNQPGVSQDYAFKWNSLKSKPLLTGYIVEGDLVSIVGKLIGKVSELTLDRPLEPLDAHVTLMSLQNRLYQYQIDVTLKNELDYSAKCD